MDITSWTSIRNTLGNGLTRIGEKTGIETLVYNPFVYQFFHEQLLINGPILAETVTEFFPDVQRVADVGCGTGVFSKEMMDRGIDVIACEYSARARKYAQRQGVKVMPWELQSGIDQQLRGGPFDLAASFEVAEHVPAALADQFVDFMAMAPTVIISAAPPGQSGHGHINEQPQSYWIEKFERRGYRYDPSASERFRSRCESGGAANWLTGNLMVFEASAVDDN